VGAYTEPEVFEQCGHILLLKDYLRYRLTRGFATEVSDAGSMLPDVSNRCWSQGLPAATDINREWLGKAYESPQVMVCVSQQTARDTGLSTKPRWWSPPATTPLPQWAAALCAKDRPLPPWAPQACLLKNLC